MVIKTRITEMFGIKHPIFSAPMGPFYTTELTIAVSEAGGLGVLSNTGLISEYEAGRSPVDIMKENMINVVEHTDKPFGFNILASRVAPSASALAKEIPKFIMDNPKIKEQCVYALTSAGSSRLLPSSKSFQKLKENSNIKHFHVAPALWLADKCIASGVDGMVITGNEGGGHQSYERVTSLILLQQVTQKYPDIPIAACGGYATGQALAAALAMGADAMVMGSRFIGSKESEFHDAIKGVIPPARAQDTVLVTGGFGPIRLWKNKYSLSRDLVASKEEKMTQEAQTSPEEYVEQSRKYELAYRGNVTDGAVLLGQSIGIINSIESVPDIIDEVIKKAEKRIKAVSAYLS